MLRPLVCAYFKLEATSANKCTLRAEISHVPTKISARRVQQVLPALLWFHANGRNMLGPTMLHVVGQQCCVRLHGP